MAAKSIGKNSKLLTYSLAGMREKRGNFPYAMGEAWEKRRNRRERDAIANRWGKGEEVAKKKEPTADG